MKTANLLLCNNEKWVGKCRTFGMSCLYLVEKLEGTISFESGNNFDLSDTPLSSITPIVTIFSHRRRFCADEAANRTPGERTGSRVPLLVLRYRTARYIGLRTGHARTNCVLGICEISRNIRRNARIFKTIFSARNK